MTTATTSSAKGSLRLDKVIAQVVALKLEGHDIIFVDIPRTWVELFDLPRWEKSEAARSLNGIPLFPWLYTDSFSVTFTDKIAKSIKRKTFQCED